MNNRQCSGGGSGSGGDGVGIDVGVEVGVSRLLSRLDHTRYPFHSLLSGRSKQTR